MINFMSDDDLEYNKIPPNSGGLPQHVPTDRSRARVWALSAHGISQDDIANILDIDPKTLTKHYRKELDTAAAEANNKVAGALFTSALGDPDKGIPPNVTAQIFWLKTRARWKEAKDPGDAGPAGTTTIIVRGGLPPLIESEPAQPQQLPAPQAPQAPQSSAQQGPESAPQAAEGSTDTHTRGFGT